MRIEKQIQFMNRKNLMQLLPDHWLSKVIRKDQEFHFIFQINSLLIKKNPFIHGTLVIKKNVFQQIGYYDERFYFAQDYKLFFDLIYSGYRVKTLNEALYVLNTKNNISSENLDKQNYYADCVRHRKEP